MQQNLSGSFRSSGCGWALVLIFASPLSSFAQEPFNWMRQDEAGCAQVAEEVAATLSPIDTRRMALTYLSRCGPVGGEALAEQLLRLRNLTDTTRMNGVVEEIAHVRDETVFSASLELAGDRGATLEARIAALRVLVQYHRPSYITSFRYYMLPQRRSLHPVGMHRYQQEGAPLPDDWEERARTLIRNLQEDSSESEAIRYAAKMALF